jgi:putative glutamine amidotransferase
MTLGGATQGRPVIGLSTYREQAAWSVWNMSADLLPAVYTRSVEAAGGVVVLLPPQVEGMAQVVSRLDGLIITGGADVDPERYGQMPHPTTKVRRDRDAWEFGLLDAADRIGLPTLGICRGMQVMAVQAGGTLEQHLPDRVGHDRHSPGPGVYGSHAVRTVAGTRVARLLGDGEVVASYHHQSVLTHPGYTAAAWSDDGTLEAIEDPDSRFRLAVQWHPETGQDARLFEALVAAARTPEG